MEKELKEYLRQCHGRTEEQIAAIERNATEADLEVLRKGMRSFLELSGGKMPKEIEQEYHQQQKAAREKTIREAREKAREERVRKKRQFALGFAIIPILSLIIFFFDGIFDSAAEIMDPADMEAAFQSAQVYLEMGISPRQLAEQMELEGCTSKEAKYIVEHCDADWNKQAVLAAEGHRDHREMSDDELLEMLVFQGFSEKQAQYGIMNSE